MLNGSRLREGPNLEWSKFSMEITENKSNGLQPASSFRSILASRDVDQLGPTTHLESRNMQNFDLEEYGAL
ncbi:hypothetical protein M514_02873 [Trichuris suis]|uniref:Uncharacterized protein n=1 Tax=Trichuris suis TaxID=68888 RepID=A0A085MFU9_9BILA|nr:hypothetical protein M513_02873 [Trichuris suis]KFD59129.1 hypothetical protein M514_02873 [Trichuris suis]